jgi:hypothetical protein
MGWPTHFRNLHGLAHHVLFFIAGLPTLFSFSSWVSPDIYFVWWASPSISFPSYEPSFPSKSIIS